MKANVTVDPGVII